MRDIWEEQLKWIESGEPFVLARVIRTWRSAPRKSGAGMLIGKGMRVAGSVSGGCIEGAVIEEALDARPPLRVLIMLVQSAMAIGPKASSDEQHQCDSHAVGQLS